MSAMTEDAKVEELLEAGFSLGALKKLVDGFTRRVGNAERQERQERQLNNVELAVYAAVFNAPYRGNFSASLLCRLDRMIEEGRSPGSRLYSYIVPILQASGFGKTRSLLELSKFGVFVFYINCQEGRSGYPLRSREADSLRVESDEVGLGLIYAVLRQLHQYLKAWPKELKQREKQLQEKQEELAAKARELEGLEELQKKLDAKKEELDELKKELATRKMADEGPIENQPSKELDAKRQQFKEFDEEQLAIQKKYLLAETRSLKTTIRNLPLEKAALMSEVELLRRILTPSSAWTADQVLLARDQQSRVGRRWLRNWKKEPTASVQQVKQAFKALVELDQLRSEALKVLFVLDECSSLFRDASGASSGYFIRRSFEHVPGLMGVVVDTKADISLLASQASLDPSLRIMSGERIPLPPICELETIHRPDLTEYAELPLEVLYTFGRPLWDGLMKETVTGTSDSVTNLLNIAVRKLLGGVSERQVKEVMRGKVTLEAAMAVFSACLSLAVVPQSCLALTLAGAYMNPVVGISEDRTSMTIMDAWDPVLSAAGKVVFRSAKFRQTALEHLVRASQDYLIDEDKKLACRYILLRAMIRAEEDGTATAEAFLKELVGQEGLEILGVLKGYVLNFDSFIPVLFPPLLRHLKEAHLMRKALICRSGQSRFDAIIPIKGPDNVVSMIGLQFKSHNHDRNFSFESEEIMDPLPAGFGEFKNFVTVLLQVHPRKRPTCKFRLIERKEGTTAILNKTAEITSQEASYLLDGLQAISFLKDEVEAKERDMLEHFITCRRLDKIKKNEYFHHLQCIVEGHAQEGEEEGQERKILPRGPPKKKRKTK